MLSTSGTIGHTQFSTQLVIDHAFRGVRMVPGQIAGEDIQTAHEQLSLMLSSWANDGTPLWCQTKYTLPLVQGKKELALAEYFPGIVDILQANLQTTNRFWGHVMADPNATGMARNVQDTDSWTSCQTGPGGWVMMRLFPAQSVTIVGLMPLNKSIWNFQLQWSHDSKNWVTFFTGTDVHIDARTFKWYDTSTFGPQPLASFWRIVATADSSLNIAELYWGNNQQEIPITRINKDDYWQLPNKDFQGRPVQYWCDRQMFGPKMWLWPAPGFQFVYSQVPVLAHRHIMDIGQMTDVVEVPQRVYDAVWTSLAERLRIVIPTVDKDATQDIPMVAGQARKLFWGEERDDSPIQLRLNISPYTA